MAVLPSDTKQLMDPSRKKLEEPTVSFVENTVILTPMVINESSHTYPETPVILTNQMKMKSRSLQLLTPQRETMANLTTQPDRPFGQRQPDRPRPTSKTTSEMPTKMKPKKSLYSISGKELYSARKAGDLLTRHNLLQSPRGLCQRPPLELFLQRRPSGHSLFK